MLMTDPSDDYAKGLGILQKYWGHQNFRDLQWDIISCVLQKKDTIALLPTGGGKSICFQIPALLMPGLCVVVTPLIALMKDQVMQLNKKGITAISLHSGMSRREIDIAIGNCIQKQYKFLYVSPERLQTESFLALVDRMNVSLIAIDEAHCISQWGYDFRPSYLKITTFTELIPQVPIIALTATATKKVVDDLSQKLILYNPIFFKKSFERKNLAYMVLYEENKLERLLKIATTIQGTGIIYARNRRLSQDISNYLNLNGISATFYNAGLTAEQRDNRQSDWINNKVKVMVCTNAFGMGIDKPDVRYVIHYSPPENIENYFQEAGRAGRDGKKSYAVMLFEKSNRFELSQQIETSFPPLHDIKRVYQGLSNYFQIAVGVTPENTFDFDIAHFCETYDLKQSMVYFAMKLLERDAYISLTEEINMPSRIKFQVNRTALYNFQVYHFKYDEFIKLLLRSYAGVFDNFITINETELAKRYGSKKSEIIKNLEFLDSRKILSYLPQKSIPQLHFTASRVDAKRLILSKEVYIDRKELALKKMEAILGYAEQSDTCRSVLLLKYFEEEMPKKCGQCDVCIAERKAELNNMLIQKLSNQIMSIIQKEPISIKQLMNHFKKFQEADVLETLNWLFEVNEVFEKNGLLYIKEK